MSQNAITERLKSLINIEKSSGEFSKKIGQHEGTIRNMLSRNSNPSFNVIASIMETYPKLNPTWFILGKGQMWLDQEPQVQEILSTDSLREIHTLKLELANRDAIIEQKERLIEGLQDHIDTLKKRKRGATTEKIKNRYDEIQKDIQDYADQEDDQENKKIS